MRLLLALAVLASACVTAAPVRDDVSITNACARSFFPTLKAWESVSREQVPEECWLLDYEYDVVVVDADAGMPCVGEPQANGLQVGCTRVDERVIYILGGRESYAMVDTSVHEWIHALADCVLGDPDREHLRAGLWVGYGATSTEAQAAAEAADGECL